MAMTNAAYAAAQAALLSQRIAGTLNEAGYAAALADLFAEANSQIPALGDKMDGVLDIKRDILTSVQAGLNLKGEVASVSALPDEAADGEAYQLVNAADELDGHLFKRVAGEWVDTGPYRGGRGASAFDVAKKVAEDAGETPPVDEAAFVQELRQPALDAAAAADEAREATDQVRLDTLDAKEATEAVTEAATNKIAETEEVRAATDIVRLATITAKEDAEEVVAAGATILAAVPAAQSARAGAEDARDQAVAISSQIKTAQSPAAARLLIVDPQDNILAEILPDKINHPDMNTVRGQAALGAALAPLIGSSGGSARFVVADDAGNMLLDVSPTTVRHPDIDAIRVQAAAGAVAGAAVKTGTALDSKLIIVDGADNLLAEINPTQIRHPDIDTIRTKANAAAVAGAAVKVSAFAEAKLIVTDESDNLLIEISPSAIKHPVIQALQAISAGFGDIVASVKTVGGGGRIAITDAADNLLGEITPSLINHPDTNSLRSRVGAVETSLANGSGADWSAVQALAEIVHLIDYGQSLSVGDSPGEPILTTSLPAYAKRFAGGVRPQDGGTDPAVIYASLTSYAEQRIGTQRNGETPLGGCLQMIAQLLAAEDGLDPTMVNQILLGSAPGEGGRSVGQLSSGSTYFDRLKDNITYGKARAGDLGKAYEVGAMIWIQGESDYSISTTRDEWKALVRKLRTDVEAHAQSVTARARPIPMIMYQTATHPHYLKTTPTIALAQLDLASEQYFAMASPCYPMPFLANDVHLQSVGYKWLGAYCGIALKRWLWDGVKPKVMAPSQVVDLGGGTVIATFPVDKGKKLVLDTVSLPNAGNYGFTAADAGGAAVTINSVTLIGTSKVKIQAAAPFKWLRYGWVGDAEKGWGNLRDNTGDALVFDPSGINKPMHRWAPIFEKGL